MAGTPEQARINGKKGGRPKGTRTKAGLERDKVMAAWRQRVFSFADNLLDAQMTLARGQTFLYRVDKEFVNTGKGPQGGFYRKKKPVLVEDEWEIRAFIEGEVEGANPHDDDDGGAAYYYMTAKEPSNQAIDSMLDRAGGKAVATTQIQGAGGGPLEVKIVKYGDNTTSPVQP